jgi:hypothetical protein
MEITYINELPRRRLNIEDPIASMKWTNILRKKRLVPCRCVEKWGNCISELLPIQGWALEELQQCSGLFGMLNVGSGKTGISILAPLILNSRRTVLMIPPALKEQFLRDYAQWSEHFHVPQLQNQAFRKEYPILYLVPYSKMSQSTSTDLMRKIAPDLIIMDEAHFLKNSTSARTKRLRRYLKECKNTRVLAMSGSMTTKAITEYAHICRWSLKERSPVPGNWIELNDWQEELSPSFINIMKPKSNYLDVLAGRGANRKEKRQAFAKRLNETSGVLTTSLSKLNIPLTYHKVENIDLPKEIKDALKDTRDLEQRPDGEILINGLSKAACLMQLAFGFYYRWIWPRNEPIDIRNKWLDARKEWNKEVRDKLKTAKEFEDSPLLLAQAAARWEHGFVSEGKKIPPKTRHLLTWASCTWKEWQEVELTARPSTEAVWISYFWVDYCMEWLKSNKGLCWYEYAEFGNELRKKGGRDIDYFGAGPDANKRIKEADGKRSAIVSIGAHHYGKNLQAFNKNLLGNHPGERSAWEQLTGRTHRYGQKNPVSIEIPFFTQELKKNIEIAIEQEKYVRETTDSERRFLYGEWK